MKKSIAKGNLDEEKKHWALKVQGRALPFWDEAFEYAYNLGKKTIARRKPRQKKSSDVQG